MSRALCIRRHPDKRVELGVARLGERMRSVEINRLARKLVDGFCVIGGQRVMRQVGMKIKCGMNPRDTAVNMNRIDARTR